jgi:hypothetical protein
VSDHPVCGANVGFAGFSWCRSHPSCIRRALIAARFQTKKELVRRENGVILEAAAEVGRSYPSGTRESAQEDGPKFHAANSGNSGAKRKLIPIKRVFMERDLATAEDRRPQWAGSKEIEKEW